MRRIGSIVALLVLAASAAAAQAVSSSTGAINGKVTDNSNAVIPGVSVTITSPAMMGSQTNVTNAEGQYRFPGVPPGEYKITYELAGFTSVVREGIRVTIGFTATVNVQLEIASLQESVTVSGASPVIDTSATKVNTNFDAQTLANLPTARDFWTILGSSPAINMSRIDVGGSAMGTQTGYFTYGTSGQSRPNVEGINASEGTSAMGNYPDVGAMDEVSIGTAAHTAEMGTPGVSSQFISKSGGNMYHGTFYSGYENEDWQSFNIDAAQIAAGLQGGGGLRPQDTNRLHSFMEVNAGLGGYIKKDKMWWYGSFRKVNVQARYTNFPVKPQTTILDNYTAKVTYNLTQNNKLITYAVPNRKRQPQRFDSYLLGTDTGINTSQDTTWNQDFWAWVYKGEINSVLTDRAFVELRAGEYGYWWRNYRYAETPRIEDTGNNLIYGGNRNWLRDRARHQVIGSITYFKSGWGGDHNLKFGGEMFDEWVADTYIDGYPGDFVSNTINGVAANVYLIGRGKSVNGLWTYSGYATDNWKIGNNLTANIGVRFDRYRGYLPAQTHDVNRFIAAQSFAAVPNVFTWNLVVPRFGLSWNITGDGKTSAKVNYAQYAWNPGADFLFNVNPNSNRWDRQYRWTDKNGNGYWDSGEEGALVASRGGVGIESLDPNTKDTYTREIAGWFERELVANVGARTGFVWRGERQNYQRVNINQPYEAFTVPIKVTDPGPDGKVGTGDDAGTIQMYNLSPAYVGLPTINRDLNAPNGGTDFSTWELSVNKRASNHWSLSFSYASTWNNQQASSLLGNTVRANTFAWTPNDFINTDQGRFKFRTEQAKVYGTWEAPFDIRVTPQLRFQRGQGFGRTFQASTNYGTVRVLAEPIGTRKQDNVSILDMRVEKAFRLPHTGTSVSAFLDAFNITDANPAQTMNWSSGSSFLRPLSVVPPRIMRLGAKFEF